MLYTIQSPVLTVQISSTGAELQSIRANGIEYLWQGDPAYWAMRSPNPFPYVAGLYQMRYRLRGKEYEMLPLGLIKDQELDAVSCKESSITFEYRSNDFTRQYYPYEFVYRLHYRVEGRRLFCRVEITNQSREMMYFGLCGHPGFNVPLEAGLRFEDYYLEFPQACSPLRVGIENRFRTDQLLPYPLQENRRLPLSHALFADGRAIFLAYTPKQVTLHSDKGRHGVTVDFPDMRYIGFFHTYGTDAPFVCIEPWTTMVGCGDRIEDLACQPDAVQLSAGSRYESEWSVTVF